MLQQTNIPFTLVKRPIDYFSLESGYFPTPFSPTKTIIPLYAGDYLDMKKHFTSFDYYKKETVALNFQVGQGKTTLCYDLIEYYEKNGYIVIVCSPFLKLIDKDYAEIKNRISSPTTRKTGIGGPLKKVFKYSDVKEMDDYLDSKSNTASAQYTVHIMTINCLLGNSGDNVVEQAFLKRNYIQNLLDAAKGRKVVLFLDEIHEAVHNFTPSLIPNLLKWNGSIEKVFIASATFTPAAVQVIKIASMLTDYNVQIWESKRIKNLKQAAIHLHIANFSNNVENAYLKIINNEIAKYQTNNRPVSVITGTKILAQKISMDKSMFLTIVTSAKKSKKKYSPTTINQLVSKNNITYQKGQNNIGTTFKTGVNIDDPNEALFVVLPYTGTTHRNSIFSDGISSIIQSMGRLRNGGEIHVFMNEPKVLVGQPQKYPLIFNPTPIQPFLPINQSYTEVQNLYSTTVKNISHEIAIMESGLSIATTNNIVASKERFGIWFPNLIEYYLTSSQSFIVQHDNASFGRLLSPYTIWAGIYDQFINGTLKQITYYTITATTVKITSSNSNSVFTNIIKKHFNQTGPISFRDAIRTIDVCLGNDIDEHNAISPIKYEDEDGKAVTVHNLIARNATYGEQAYKAIYKCCNSVELPFGKNDKGAYINACIVEALACTLPNIDRLTNGYMELAQIKTEFQSIFEKTIQTNSDGRSYSPTSNKDELLDDGFIAKATEILDNLKKSDIVLKSKAFSLLQNTITDAKTSMYNFLFDLCYVKDSQRKHKIGNVEVIFIKLRSVSDNLSLL